MNMAREMAGRSTCPRADVGCAIVTAADSCIGGWNGAPDGVETCRAVGCVAVSETDERRAFDRHVHAEVRAIGEAARRGESTEGASIYVTLAPCLDCAKLICVAGIREVFIPEATPFWISTVGQFLIDGGVRVRVLGENL